MTQVFVEKPLRILIVEDHELVRYALKLSLSEQENIEVIGEAENGQEAIEIATSQKPDIILMDIGLPVINGIAATQAIKAKLPRTKIIMFTSIDKPDQVLSSMASGANGYCKKEESMDRLLKIIKGVSEGGTWLDPAIAQLVIRASLDRPNHRKSDYIEKKDRTELTVREHEILKLVTGGSSNKEIADHLNISSHTVKTHVSNIMCKFDVSDRTQVAVKAMAQGL